MKYLNAINLEQAVSLRTVNVIEIIHDRVAHIHSFADNPQGNKKAEKVFRRLFREHNDLSLFTDADIDPFILGGVYDDNSGYQLVFIHSV